MVELMIVWFFIEYLMLIFLLIVLNETMIF